MKLLCLLVRIFSQILLGLHLPAYANRILIGDIAVIVDSVSLEPLILLGLIDESKRFHTGYHFLPDSPTQ